MILNGCHVCCCSVMTPKRGLPDPPHRGRSVGLGEASRIEAKPKTKSNKKSQGEKKRRVGEQSLEVKIRQPPFPLQNVEQ